ncbi:MAG: DNA-3-methyladenine glycosylase [Phormidesmis sp.]
MTTPSHLPADWFNRSSQKVAVELLGCTFVRQVPTDTGLETIRGQIVETEAYEAGDPAMYAYQRKTPHNEVVFGPAGIVYIYRIYRQYHCFNIVTDRDGLASTILIRAIDLEKWPSYVPPKKEKLERLGAGPGKFCIAYQLDESLKGMPVHPDSGIWVEPRSPEVDRQITADSAAIRQTTRIGLSKGTDIPWRWYLENSSSVSKKIAKVKQQTLDLDID